MAAFFRGGGVHLWSPLLFLCACVACSPVSGGGEDVVVVPKSDGGGGGAQGADDGGVPLGGAMLTQADAEISRVDAAPMAVERRVLHECFSGSNCGPCAPSADRLSAIFEANPGKFTAIKYQIGSDPYISREAVNRRMMYLPGEETYGIPYVHADGINGFHPNEINNDEGYQQHNFDGFQSLPSPLDMQVSHTIDGKTITVEVILTAYDAVVGNPLRLFIAVIENVTYENVGSNGQTEFHLVFKKFIPDDSGLPLDGLAAGEQMAITREYTFQGDYNGETGIRNMVQHNREHTVEEFEDLAVVAFVQDMEDWQVHQSAWDAPDHPDPQGSVEGQVLLPDGTPAANAPMTSCDDVECLTGMTDEQGRYRFSGLPTPTRKMEAIGPDGALDLIFAQEVGPDHPPVTVSLVPAVGEAVPWPVETGGTVTLSGGQLELTAAPGTLAYPLGTEESVRAGVLSLSELAPYAESDAVAPWLAEDAAGIAFVLNPVHIQSSAPVGFVVRATNAGRVSPPEGDLFDVYSVDPDTALYRRVGTAQRNEALEIVGSADASLTDLSVLILVRQGPAPGE